MGRHQTDRDVSFELARAAFGDPNGLIEPDDDLEEERWHWIGMTANLVLLVVYTERVVDDEPRTRTRIISARKANRHEQQRYHRQGT